MPKLGQIGQEDLEMVAEIAAGWAFGKIADLVWDGAKGSLQDKLTRTDIERAVAAGLKAAQSWNENQPIEQRLFFRCDTVQQGKFKSQVFADAGVQAELVKALTNQGQPDVAFLVAQFKRIAAEAKLPITEAALEPWLRQFVTTFFEQTQTFIRYQVARADYLQQLANWFDDVKFAGIAVAGQEVERSEQLAQIFVMPELQEETSGSSSIGLVDLPGIPEANRQFQLLQEQRFRAERDASGRKLSAELVLKQNQSKLVLLGAPGSGKTTLLSYFAVKLARSGAAELGLEADCLPILIRIRDWARQPDLSLPDYARQFAEKAMSVKPLPVGFFEYWLDGRALILLDGLDEVAEAAKRHHMVQCIENFLGQYDQNRAVITSRPAGYRRDFFRTDEYPHYQLLPFGDTQQQDFINRWYDSRIADPAEAERRKTSLRKAFTDNERIKLLARNPLLLTIIALIHRYQAVLPKQRFKLYEKAVETLLTAWDSNKELTNQTVLKYLDLDDLQRLMERIAYWIHTQGGTGDQEGGTLIDRDELLNTLCREIQVQKQVQRYQAKEEAERFIEFIRDRTGLLNEQGQDCYAFVHKTFQEYLTAQEIIYQAENEADFEIVLNHIRDHLHDPHWEEVLLLLIAQQKPNNAAKAISAVLDHNSPYEKWLHRDLFFAGRCLAENPKGLKTAKGSRTDEVLARLVELEALDENLTGDRVKSELKRVLCSLYETDFAAQALEMLKQVENIDDFRLKNYRIELGDEQEVVIQECLKLLHHQKLEVCSNAAKVIKAQGIVTEEIISSLMELLRKESASTGTRYYLWTSKSGPGDPIDAILTYSGEGLFPYSSAEEALAFLGRNSDMVLTNILNLIEGENPSIRRILMNILGYLGKDSTRCLYSLSNALQDQDATIRAKAAQVIGRLGNSSETVLHQLQSLLNDETSLVHFWATIAISKLSDRPDIIFNHFPNLLNDENPSVRFWSAIILRELGYDPQAIFTCLLELLDYDEMNSRELGALIKFGDNIEILRSKLLKLSVEDGRVRYDAARGLGELGDSTTAVLRCLYQLLNDEETAMRYCAAEALIILGENSESVISSSFDLLKCEKSWSRQSLATTLGECGKKNPDILFALENWLEEQRELEYIGSAVDALWLIVCGD